MSELTKLKGQETFRFRKYSDYEIKDFDGKKYVIPAENAKINEFDPFVIMDDLMIDFLKLGKLLLDKRKYEESLLGFCRNYGLFGFVNEYCYNWDFERDKLIFIKRSAPLKRGQLIKTDEYLSWFFPIGSPKLIKAGVAERYIINILQFSSNYAERLDWICSFIEFHYMHLMSLHNFRLTPHTLNDAYRPTANLYRTENSGLSVGVTDKPELSWNFSSLKAVIETVYSLEVTTEKPKLKICKTCLEPFIAKNPKSEFCSKRCGNLMHVRNFRR